MVQRKRVYPISILSTEGPMGTRNSGRFLVTSSGAPFLQFDSGPCQDRIIIDAITAENLTRLQSAENWFADGTFKVSPKNFFKCTPCTLFSMGSAFALVYALLPNKSTETYTRFLNQLKILNPDLNHDM